MPTYTATDGTQFDNIRAFRRYEFETQFTFKGRAGERLLKSPGSINGQAFDLADLSDCEVILLDHSDQVQCDEVRDSRVFVAACCESLFVRDCSGCTFTVACKQLRTRDCTDCTFYLYSKTEPVIETSSNLRFAPFNGAYQGHEEHLRAANLESPNLWYAIYDFNDEAKTNVNWSILPKDTEEAVWRPLDDGAALAVPRSEPGSVPLPKKEGEDGSFMSFSIATGQETATALVDAAGSSAAPPPAIDSIAATGANQAKAKPRVGWRQGNAAGPSQEKQAPLEMGALETAAPPAAGTQGTEPPEGQDGGSLQAVPLRLGLQRTPPALVLEYMEGGRIAHKCFRFKRGLRGDAASTAAAAQKLQVLSPELLGPDNVNVAQLTRLLASLGAIMSGTEGSEGREGGVNAAVTAEKRLDAGVEGDLNGVSDAELQAAKQNMDVTFKRNLVVAGDPNYVHDRQVEFEATEVSEWDEDDHDDSRKAA